MRIGFAANLEKAGVAAHRDELMRVARAEGVACVFYQTADALAQETRIPDFLVVIGGDGSILRYVQPAARLGVPIVGVNLGRIGFLTEIASDGFGGALKQLMSGAYAIEERMMLAASVDGGEARECLNDVLVFKSSFSGIAQIDVSVDDMDVGTVFCDGIVAATPTGATAYSLSAGGPVVAKGLDATVVTPICSHTLHIRPIVSAPDARWVFRVSGEGFVATDGMKMQTVGTGQRVVVTRAQRRAKFVSLHEKNIFDLIKIKLN